MLKKQSNRQKIKPNSWGIAKGGEPVKNTCNIKELIKSVVSFDEGQICQVINNLIINAAQAMPDGGTINNNSC